MHANQPGQAQPICILDILLYQLKIARFIGSTPFKDLRLHYSTKVQHMVHMAVVYMLTFSILYLLLS